MRLQQRGHKAQSIIIASQGTSYSIERLLN